MLIKCRQCGKKYSVKSPRCPYCKEYRPRQYDKIAEELCQEEMKTPTRTAYKYNHGSTNGNTTLGICFFFCTLLALFCLFKFTAPSKSYIEATSPTQPEYEPVPYESIVPSVPDSHSVVKPKSQNHNRPRPSKVKSAKTKASSSNFSFTKKDTNSYVIDQNNEESLGEVIDKILTARKQRKTVSKSDDLKIPAGLPNVADSNKNKKSKLSPAYDYSSGGDVYVRGYYRNGHYVRSHTRSRPGLGRRRR